MTGGRVLVASLLIGLPPGAPAPAKGEPARTVALALSGGGARGIAHIGVLRALEENQIPVDFIAGTSMGAVIGAFYASGYSAEEIARIVRGIDWQSIFSGKPERSLVPLSARLGETPRILSVGYDFFRLALPESALADYPIHRVLTRYLAGPSLAAGGDFDRLPIPFRAVAADLRTGSRVVHARGDLARAVRSSMSIPLAFSPVRLGDQVLVDGGIVDNLPVDVACGLGADFVLAVDVTSPPLPPERYRDLLGIASQLTDILAASANRNHQERANLLLRPELHGHRFTDYSNFESLIESGYQAAMAEMPSLLDLVAQRPAGERRAAAGLAGRRLTAVWVEGERHIAEEPLRRALGLRPGAPVDVEGALGSLDALYAGGFLETCWLEFLADGSEGAVAVLHVEEAERGRLELGGAYNDENKVSAFLRVKHHSVLGAGERTEILARASDAGSGVRLALLRDRMIFGSRFGGKLEAEWSEDKPRFFRERHFVNRAEFDRQRISAAAMAALSRSGLIQAGLSLGRVQVRERLGLDFAPGPHRVRLLRTSVVWDDLDDPYAARRGRKLSLAADRSLAALGASDDYLRVEAGARLAAGLSPRHVFDGQLELGLSWGDLPVYEQFRLGGPVLLPGVQRDALWGSQSLALAARHEILLTGRLRFRYGVGAGAVWHRRREISLDELSLGFGAGFQFMTAAGPISVDYGRARSGGSRVYFGVGFQ